MALCQISIVSGRHFSSGVGNAVTVEMLPSGRLTPAYSLQRSCIRVWVHCVAFSKISMCLWPSLEWPWCRVGVFDLPFGHRWRT